MATLNGGGTLPPGAPSTSQASTTNSSVNRSAARCCVFRGKKIKLIKDEKLTKAQSKHTQAGSSVAFEYSASSITSVSTSATNTSRQLAQATRAHGRNAALSLHYLKRQIKLIISKTDLYNHNFARDVNWFTTKLSSYVRNLDNKIQQLNASKDAHADVVREYQRLKDERDSYSDDLDVKIKYLKDSHDNVVGHIQYLNATKDDIDQDFSTFMKGWKADTNLDAHELDRKIKNITVMKYHYHRGVNEQIEALNATKDVYATDLDIHIKLLNAKNSLYVDDLDKRIDIQIARKDLLTRDLIRQVQLVNARKDSYTQDAQRRLDIFNAMTPLFYDEIRLQSQLVNSKKTPFVHDLDRQLKQLDSKLAAFFRDFEKNEDLLISCTDSYFENEQEKMELLNRSMASYLGIDIQLLN